MTGQTLGSYRDAPARVAALLLALVLLVTCGVLYQGFFRYIKCAPIKQRRPYLVLMGCAALVGGLLSLYFDNLVSSYPCFLSTFGYITFANLLSWTVLARGWMILFENQMTQNLLQIGRAKTPQEAKVGWYLKHRAWMKNSLLKKAFACELVCLVAVAAVFGALDSEMSEADRCFGNTAPVLVGNGMLAMKPLVLFVLVKLMPEMKQGVWIKQELLLLATSMLVLAVVEMAGVHELSYQAEGIHALLHVLFYSMFCAASLGVPLYRATKLHSLNSTKKHCVDAEDQYDDIPLERIVGTESGYMLFLEFLSSEFSTENLLFWKAVQDYKELCQTGISSKSLMHKALFLNDRFIVAGAPMEVNVDSSVRKECVRVMSSMESRRDKRGARTKIRREMPRQPLEQVYDAAIEVIVALMRTDSYPRFKRSRLFPELVASEDFKEVVQEVRSPREDSRLGSQGGSAAKSTEKTTGSEESNGAGNGILGWLSDKLTTRRLAGSSAPAPLDLEMGRVTSPIRSPAASPAQGSIMERPGTELDCAVDLPGSRRATRTTPRKPTKLKSKVSNAQTKLFALAQEEQGPRAAAHEDPASAAGARARLRQQQQAGASAAGGPAEKDDETMALRLDVQPQSEAKQDEDMRRASVSGGTCAA